MKESMKFHTVRLACMASLGTVIAPALQAQDFSPAYYYIGLGIGQSQSQLDENSTTASLFGAANGSVIASRNQQDTLYKLFGGYQLNRHIALELGYFNLGKLSYTTNSLTGSLNGQYEVEGANLDVIGTLPVTDRFSVLARVGAQYANTRTSFSGTGTLKPLIPGPSERDTNMKVGVGLQYDISPNLQIRGEAERHRINDGFGNRGDINAYSVSLVFPLGRTALRTRSTMSQTPYVAPVQIVQSTVPPAALATSTSSLAVPPTVRIVAPAPVARKRVQVSADSTFSFDKSVLNSQGKGALDTFARETQGLTFDAVNVQGNADRLGTQEYNQKLSERRAYVVKAYLQGTPELRSATINITGKGETDPVTKPEDCVGKKTTPTLVNCLAPDRRVDVEVIGMR